MTNGEKFKEVFGISQVDEGELYAFAWLPNHDAAEIPIDWWNAEYKAKGFLSKSNKIIKTITPQEPRWIPVSERLPKANIYDGHGPVWKHEVLITGYLSYDDKKETFVNMVFAEDVRNKCVPNTNVTAWMPLPKPYEPQESEEV